MSFNDEPVRPYMFPIVSNESLYFAVSGAFVDRAILITGKNLLALAEPHYDIPENQRKDATPPMVDLDFFGPAPFHAALAQKWNPYVILYTRDTRLPSLVLKPAAKSVTWDDLTGSMYMEDVLVRGSKDPQTAQKRVMVYCKEYGGFRRDN